jgi:hypothetical protein
VYTDGNVHGKGYLRTLQDTAKRKTSVLSTV